LNKLWEIVRDFLLVFVGTFIAQVLIFGTDLLDTDWSEWKQAIASAIIGGLTVIMAFINPVMQRYGLKGK
jgi:hypothetical protein